MRNQWKSRTLVFINSEGQYAIQLSIYSYFKQKSIKHLSESGSNEYPRVLDYSILKSLHVPCLKEWGEWVGPQSVYFETRRSDFYLQSWNYQSLTDPLTDWQGKLLADAIASENHLLVGAWPILFFCRVIAMVGSEMELWRLIFFNRCKEACLLQKRSFLTLCNFFKNSKGLLAT